MLGEFVEGMDAGDAVNGIIGVVLGAGVVCGVVMGAGEEFDVEVEGVNFECGSIVKVGTAA